MSTYYIGRVRDRAAALLEQHRNLLPPQRFETRVALQGGHSTRVIVALIPERVDGHYVCDEGFRTVCDLLNREFENDRHCAGIEVEVPAGWVDGFVLEAEPVDLGSRTRTKRGNHG